MENTAKKKKSPCVPRLLQLVGDLASVDEMPDEVSEALVLLLRHLHVSKHKPYIFDTCTPASTNLTSSTPARQQAQTLHLRHLHASKHKPYIFDTCAPASTNLTSSTPVRHQAQALHLRHLHARKHKPYLCLAYVNAA